MVQELTPDSWDTNVTKSNLPVIVDFWAPWCGPCKMMAPVFEGLASQYQDKLSFAKINTQDFPQMASTHMVSGIPCLVVFNKGEEVGRIVGFKPKDQLIAAIESELSKI